MKSKFPFILRILLFIIGATDLLFLFVRSSVPTTLSTITVILLFIASLSDFVITLKPRKLAYPISIIYFFIGTPIVEKFIHNHILIIGYTFLGLFITMIFLYNDLIITAKEKNLPA